MVVVFKAPAARDIQEIYEWYEGQSEGLGEDFLEEVDTIISHIALYPRSFGFRYKNFRMGALSKFPYLVFYHIEKDNIIIHRISHAHRNKRKLKF